MTASQTGGTEYDARIRRAERLTAQHEFAREFLEFYRHVATFQKTLRANIASSGGEKFAGGSLAGIRDPLDLTVLLPVFVGESNYEGGNNGGCLSSVANAFIVRQEAFYTMTSGGAGNIWGNESVNHYRKKNQM